MKLLKIALTFGALSILVIATGAVRLGQTAADTGPAFDTHFMRELYSFTSLAAMVATSDVVVLGTVTSAGPGRQVRDDGDTGGLSFTNVDVRVERLLHGSAQPTLRLEIDEVSLGDNVDWTVPGATVVLALTRISVQPSLYRPTNTQSVFLITGKVVTPGLYNDPFTSGVAAGGTVAVLRHFEDAAKLVSEGDVTPPSRNQLPDSRE